MPGLPRPTALTPASPFRATAEGGSGLTRAQARGARFVMTSRGIRVPAAADDAMRRAAAVLGAGPDSLLIDLSAAIHWGLPVPMHARRAAQAAATVARPPGGSRPERADTRGRRVLLPAGHVTEWDCCAVTTPARTWVDCAALLRPADLVAMGDAILHRELASEVDLDEVVEWARGRRGVLVARRCLPLLDGRAESPQESIVRVRLVEGGLPRPECNLNINASGVWIARVDLAWPDAKLIVEYDGAVHLDERQRRRDAARRNALQRAGWLVITLTADDLRHPERMIRHVAGAYRARTA